MPIRSIRQHRDQILRKPVDGHRLPVGVDEADPATRPGHRDKLGDGAIGGREMPQ
jgi:hypothetical protein